ncbi:hypothetical protein FRB94_012074 [Tulasnella sp. JGI-2019a]|nr:hypothetical protein FRB94_012074 [Tulasnella sp. JGI-2019a]
MSHTGDQGEPSEASLARERRFKLSRACDRCRRRRIKCDEGHPCNSCSNSNSECTFEEMGKKAVTHKSKRSTLEERMQQIEALVNALPSGLFNGTGPMDASPGSPHSVTASKGPPMGVPPPSLSARTLVNPARHFMSSVPTQFSYDMNVPTADHTIAPLASSYLYLDDQGSTRWQGEMSGFPLLDLLIEHEYDAGSSQHRSESPESTSPGVATMTEEEPSTPAPDDWFPDRQSIKDIIRPEDIWTMVSAVISPDLMDSLVKCWLSTTYYLMPFIHVPSFLSDYANPVKWDSGFGSFIVAICCLTSRHVDDIRVRSDPRDAFSAGTSYFELFNRLRSLPGADRPTLYTVQSVLLAAVYAIGLGKLSRGLALLSEAVTLCIDAGLHRSVAQYDHFNCIETEVRKRTFWSVYAWDKQASAYFGRPPVIRLRDCDVPEPEEVDDEFITKDCIGVQPPGTTPLVAAFIACNRLYVIVEAVLDVHPVAQFATTPMSFLARASSSLSGFRQSKDLKEAEAVLDEWCHLLPQYWAVTPETMASRDVVRITQAERLHCMEHFVRMLIYRYRFSVHVANVGAPNDRGKEVAMRMSQRSALQIIAKHLEISSLGLMTYYGLFVIHQLTQAGRTLIAVLLECKADETLVTSSLEALKACVGLLRRFSGRYVCGLRAADLLEEICRLSRIPLDVIEQPTQTYLRPAWLRPVRKRHTSRTGQTPDFSSMQSPATNPSNGPAAMSDIWNTQTSSSQVPMHPMVTNTSMFDPQFIAAQGGFMQPLTQGTVAPLTADMFGSNEISGFSADDLLALLGGANAGGNTSLGHSLLQPPVPYMPGSDMGASMAPPPSSETSP